MNTGNQQSLKDVLRGYQEFNQWQTQEQQALLPRLSVADGLQQFFELCDLVRAWHPNSDLALQWLEEEQANWVRLLNRHLSQERAA